MLKISSSNSKFLASTMRFDNSMGQGSLWLISDSISGFRFDSLNFDFGTI